MAKIAANCIFGQDLGVTTRQRPNVSTFVRTSPDRNELTADHPGGFSSRLSVDVITSTDESALAWTNQAPLETYWFRGASQQHAEPDSVFAGIGAANLRRRSVQFRDGCGSSFCPCIDPYIVVVTARHVVDWFIKSHLQELRDGRASIQVGLQDARDASGIGWGQ